MEKSGVKSMILYVTLFFLAGLPVLFFLSGVTAGESPSTTPETVSVTLEPRFPFWCELSADTREVEAFRLAAKKAGLDDITVEKIARDTGELTLLIDIVEGNTYYSIKKKDPSGNFAGAFIVAQKTASPHIMNLFNLEIKKENENFKLSLLKDNTILFSTVLLEGKKTGEFKEKDNTSGPLPALWLIGDITLRLKESLLTYMK